jgi:hypothetical protein
MISHSQHAPGWETIPIGPGSGISQHLTSGAMAPVAGRSRVDLQVSKGKERSSSVEDDVLTYN